MQTHFDNSAHASVSTGAPGSFELALLKTAGGDPQLAMALRQLAWERYLAAGTPCGMSEEGMAAWWNERLTTLRN